MKITVISASRGVLLKLIQAYQSIQRKHPGILDLELIYGATAMSEPLYRAMEQSLITSDILLVELTGSTKEMIQMVHRALEKCSGDIVPLGNVKKKYLRLGELSAEDITDRVWPMDKVRDIKNLSLIQRYLKGAEGPQLEKLLYLLLREYGGYAHLSVPSCNQEIDVVHQ